ncbi:MAG: galactokinase, partial [Clostridiales bacterium]|nr:galactokinase [Clostridiales bacterium]
VAQRGYRNGGFKGYPTSDVLSGSGMSSSAAYEVMIGTVLSGLYNDMKLDPVDIARIGQYAENVYFGKPCGLMDQTACSVGGLIHIDFADPDHMLVKKIDVDFEAYDHCLCITDTKGSHADLTDDYAAIPVDMKKVATYFGKEYLREVDEKEFYAKLADLRQAVGDRAVLRALHFFEEEKRVDLQIASLEAGDFDGFKKWIKASGASSFQFLQNVFTVHQLDEQGVSIGLAVSDTVLGDRGVSRVHGGGFAGTIQAFVPNAVVAEYREALDQVFGEGSCHVLKVRKYGGMRVL